MHHFFFFSLLLILLRTEHLQQDFFLLSCSSRLNLLFCFCLFVVVCLFSFTQHHFSRLKQRPTVFHSYRCKYKLLVCLTELDSHNAGSFLRFIEGSPGFEEHSKGSPGFGRGWEGTDKCPGSSTGVCIGGGGHQEAVATLAQWACWFQCHFFCHHFLSFLFFSSYLYFPFFSVFSSTLPTICVDKI